MKKTIVIVGGHGQMGQLFRRLFQTQGHSISALGEDDWLHAKKILPAADMVMIAVPIAVTGAVIRKVAPYLKSDCLLTDITSTKQKPLQTMCAAHPGPVLGLHPVFGPTIDKPNGHVIVYCEGRNLSAAKWLLDALGQMAFTLHACTAEQHDQMMNFIQGLQHFITYCTGVFLKQQGVDLQTLLAVATPLFRLQLDMLGRIFYQDAHLYADILMSSDSRAETLKNFMTLSQHLLKQIETKDHNAFVQDFQAVTQWLGPFAKQAQDKTDDLLNKA